MVRIDHLQRNRLRYYAQIVVSASKATNGVVWSKFTRGVVFRSEEDLPTCDLLIVAGTSLVVSPANSLVYRVPEETIRVVVNNERVGENLDIDYVPIQRETILRVVKATRSSST